MHTCAWPGREKGGRKAEGCRERAGGEGQGVDKKGYGHEDKASGWCSSLNTVLASHWLG